MMPSPTVLGTDHSLVWSAFVGKLGSARIFTGLGLDFGHTTLCKRQRGRDNYDTAMAVGARDSEKNAEVTFLPGCQEGAHLLFGSLGSVWPSSALQSGHHGSCV